MQNEYKDPALSDMAKSATPKVHSLCQFILGEKLGEGTFGVVRLATHILTRERVAVKILEKVKILEQADKTRVEREIKILKVLRHNNIIHLYSVIQTNNTIYLIMEYANGKELFEYIIKKKRLHEGEACMFYQQLLSGIEYLHKLRIVHRDLKPENLLLNSRHEIKIVDFGLSNLYKKGEMLSTACGSPCYAAPEMINGNKYHGVQVDIWSSGIILFAMICGYLPFEDPDNESLYRKITDGRFSMPHYISDQAKDLIKRILTTDPRKRITIAQIKLHSWFNLLSPSISYHEGLLIRVNVIPIDEEIVCKMVEYNYNKREVRINLLLNKHNHITTTYHLMLQKKIRKGIPSIADLCSIEFIEYIRDPSNLMIKYHNNLDEVVSERTTSYANFDFNLAEEDNEKDKEADETKDITPALSSIAQIANKPSEPAKASDNEKTQKTEPVINVLTVTTERTKPKASDRTINEGIPKRPKVVTNIFTSKHKDMNKAKKKEISCISKHLEHSRGKNRDSKPMTSKEITHFIQTKNKEIISKLKTGPSQSSKSKQDRHNSLSVGPSKPSQCKSPKEGKKHKSQVSSINRKAKVLSTESSVIRNKHSTEQRERHQRAKHKYNSNNTSLIYTEPEIKPSNVLDMQLKLKLKQKDKKRRIHNKSLPDAVLHLMINDCSHNAHLAKPSMNKEVVHTSVPTPKKVKRVNSDKAVKFKMLPPKQTQSLIQAKDRLEMITQLRTISHHNDALLSRKLGHKAKAPETERLTQQNLIQKRYEKNKQKRFFNTSVSFERTIDETRNCNLSHPMRTIDLERSQSPEPEQKRERDKNYLKRKAVNKKFDIIKEEDEYKRIVNQEYHTLLHPQALGLETNRDVSPPHQTEPQSSRLHSLNKNQASSSDKLQIQTVTLFKETINASSSNKLRTCSSPIEISCVILKPPHQVKEDLLKAFTHLKVRFKAPSNQPYRFFCEKAAIRFELELYHLTDIPDGLLIKSMRVDGNIVTYRDIIRAIISKIVI